MFLCDIYLNYLNYYKPIWVKNIMKKSYKERVLQIKKGVIHDISDHGNGLWNISDIRF